MVIEKLSKIHKAEHLSGVAATWFRAGQLGLAAAFVATALIGIVMVLRITRPAWLAWACLAAGVIIPVLLALAARAG